jgi:hypothetical protein
MQSLILRPHLIWHKYCHNLNIKLHTNQDTPQSKLPPTNHSNNLKVMDGNLHACVVTLVQVTCY